VTARLDFDLPPALEAHEPPEGRGLTRDAVRLLVAERRSGRLTHSTFGGLPDHLTPGDLVVVNTSATIPGAVAALAPNGTPLVVHLSTRLADGRWVVELRRPNGAVTSRWRGDPPSRHLVLGEGAWLDLVGPHLGSSRLWVAELSLPQPDLAWLAVNGAPIRYAYVSRPWPLSAYQTVWAREPGSAEMPSAGRPFTPEIVTRLVARGVAVVPIVLHTGVASLEDDERPYPERVVVPPATAALVHATREAGGRVVAVGTTVVRALESAASADGSLRPVDGWTDLVVTPERGVRVVDGILTGWHEPRASHLLLLEAIAGRDLLRRSYEAALARGYRWHEFGDVHLILA
jgi:S-adenosylmethionine:tRNA ribosyltransferase-isomerase